MPPQHPRAQTEPYWNLGPATQPLNHEKSPAGAGLLRIAGARLVLLRDAPLTHEYALAS